MKHLIYLNVDQVDIQVHRFHHIHYLLNLSLLLLDFHQSII